MESPVHLQRKTKVDDFRSQRVLHQNVLFVESVCTGDDGYRWDEVQIEIERYFFLEEGGLPNTKILSIHILSYVQKSIIYIDLSKKRGEI